MGQVLYTCDSIELFVFLSFGVLSLKVSCLDVWFTSITGAASDLQLFLSAFEQHPAFCTETTEQLLVIE